MIRFEKGKAVNSSDRGWIAGHMIPKTGLASTPAFEIKAWNYSEAINYGKKTFGGTEFIIIYGGRLRLILSVGKEFEFLELNGWEHEYIIIAPNVVKEVVVVESPAFGVTVRWPSAPGLNQVVSPPEKA